MLMVLDMDRLLVEGELIESEAPVIDEVPLTGRRGRWPVEAALPGREATEILRDDVTRWDMTSGRSGVRAQHDEQVYVVPSFDADIRSTKKFLLDCPIAIVKHPEPSPFP
jgi:hypothetical protein